MSGSQAGMALVLMIATAPVEAWAREPVFPIDAAITSDENRPVADRVWLDGEVAFAEHMLGPLGVHVRLDHVRPLGADLARIEEPVMRDRFAPLVTAHEIQIFVVRSLRDDAQVGLYRRGVTWDSHPSTSNGPSKRFIILVAGSGESVLAHELGHFFGNHTHSTVKNNLMSYERDGGVVFLDPAQEATIKATAAALRTSNVLAVIDWLGA